MAKRTYSKDVIEVHWDSDRCIHTGWCSKELLAVFNPQQRPWIQVEHGTVDEIIHVIENCPSGALSYTRTDGGPQEPVEQPATIVPWPNGPYHVRGSYVVQDRHGETFDAGPRATLCRCGHSNNQPFCDLSHREAKFRSYPRVAESDGEADG